MYLVKLFIYNKSSLLYLFTALVSALIIVSSFSASIIYVERILESSTNKILYDVALCIRDKYGNGLNGSLNRLINLENEINHNGLLMMYLSNIITDELLIDNISLKNIILFYVYIPGLNYSFLEDLSGKIALKPGIHDLSIYNYSVKTYYVVYSSRESSYTYMLYNLSRIITNVFNVKNIDKSRIALIHNYITQLVNTGYLTTRYKGYRILLLLSGSYRFVNYLDKTATKSNKHVYSQANVYDIIGKDKVYRLMSYTTLYVLFIRFNREEIIRLYSVDASRNNLLNIIDKIYDLGSDKGFQVGLIDSPLYDALYSLSGLEMITRISIIASLLPAFAIIWITSSIIAPMILTPIHKILALLRIRGVKLRIIYSSYIVSVIIYVITGAIFGFFLGPLPVLLIYKRIELYGLVLNGLLDPLSLVLIVSIIIIVLLSSIHRSFKAMKKITPLEYFKGSYFHEYIKHGLDKTMVILIALSIYFVLRVFNIINPYELSSTSGSALLSIVIALLFVLEPIILFFGPVIFVYTITRIFIKYPSITGSAISLIAGLIIGRLKGLVYRIISVKPSKITLAMVSYSFSISLLILGILGSTSIVPVFDKIMYSASSGVDYVLYKYIVLDHDTDLDNYASQMINTINKFINGSLTYGFLYLGETPLRREYSLSGSSIIINDERIEYGIGVLIDDAQIQYILFLPSNSTSTLNYPVEINSNNIVFVDKDSRLEEGIMYVWINGSKIEVLSGRLNKARNLPCPLCFYLTASPYIGGFDVETAEYAPNAILYIVHPSSSGVVLSTINYRSVVSRYNDTRSVFIFYVFIRGSIDLFKAASMGYKVVCLKSYIENIENTGDYFVMSFTVNTMTGLALYFFALVIGVETIYTIIYEDLPMYSVMYNRGFPSRRIKQLVYTLTVSLLVVSIIPGLVLGYILAAGLPLTALFSMPRVARKLVEYYGVTYSLVLDPASIYSIIAILLVPFIIALVEANILYHIVVTRRMEYIRGEKI